MLEMLRKGKYKLYLVQVQLGDLQFFARNNFLKRDLRSLKATVPFRA